jgi:putative tryptophan/tyrosine transport system substrate-binding protein
MAGDLVRRQVSVIAATSTPANLVAKPSTSTIPIVFTTAVQLGLIASLNRPGANVTGVVTLNVEIVTKQLQLLHELVPTASSMALLVNPTDSALAETATKEVRAAAHTPGLELHVLNAGDLPLQTSSTRS